MTNLVLVKDYIPQIIENLRYSTANNVCHRPISNYTQAYLPIEVTLGLKKAANKFIDDGYTIKIWDAVRSQSTQNELRKINSDANFVSDNSNHIKGLAVDMTLVDKHGIEVDAGTDFDKFSAQAGNKADGLTSEQTQLRKYLESTMSMAGFKQSQYEWWHFDYIGNKKDL